MKNKKALYSNRCTADTLDEMDNTQNEILKSMDNGDFYRATSMATEYVASYPDLSMAHSLLSLVKYMVGDYHGAILAANKALELWKYNLLAFCVSGHANFCLDNLEVAEGLLWRADECLRILTGYIDGKTKNRRSKDKNLARARIENTVFDQLNFYLVRDPKVLKCIDLIEPTLIEIMELKGDKNIDYTNPSPLWKFRYLRSIDHCSSHIESAPENADLYLCRAKMYKEIGMYDEFLDDANTARKLDPSIEKQVKALLRGDSGKLQK